MFQYIKINYKKVTYMTSKKTGTRPVVVPGYYRKDGTYVPSYIKYI